jgi:hypothetical protein
MTQYIIDSPLFTVKYDSNVYTVNEYTLRNLLVASMKEKIDFELEVKEDKNSIPYFTPVIKGEYQDRPISNTGKFDFDLLVNLKFDLLKLKGCKSSILNF